MAFWVILHDTLSHRLHDHGFPGFGRSHNHRALTLTKRAEKINDPVRQLRLVAPGASALKNELLVWVHRAQLIELGASLCVFGRAVIHERQVGERRALPATRALANDAHEFIAGTETVSLDDA
jgi:hypothetical protein